MRIWDETGRDPGGREGALAVLPSVSEFSRTSLLCGKPRSGSQAEERAGFAAFWHGRRGELFHKAGLPAGPGARLSPAVYTALGEPSTAVAVVLNTIDDAVHASTGGISRPWRLADIAYLPELLTAAAGAGRPVILTSDHGHVPDRPDSRCPVPAEAARYRQGTPGEGEVLVAGPRVLADGGSAVLAWDERIRYTSRKAGYHGGASLAEVVIPVLVFVPAGAAIPKGWTRFGTPSLHEPAWWNPPTPAAGGEPPARPATTPAPPARKGGQKPPPGADTLFSDADIPAPASLGTQVTASPLYAAQRTFVRKAPADTDVAAVIDALAQAGGKLPLAPVASASGQPPFRMTGYLTQLGRLLNVDGYPVITAADEGRTVTLNVALLREQFLGGGG
jgi:hypothetical protein